MKIKELRSELVSFEGGIATFKLLDQLDVDKVQELAKDGKFYAYIDFVDERDRSEEQRKHFYALVGDISQAKGLEDYNAELMMKALFADEFDLPELPSMKKRNMSRKQASKFIDFVIDWMIWNDVPFRKNMLYLADDTNKILYAMTMNRVCWVTGKKGADLHHATNLVGMGQDRTKYNHLDSKFMTLSREAHNEIHNIGLTAFMDKYVVAPISLNKRDLKQLGIRGDYTKEDNDD